MHLWGFEVRPRKNQVVVRYYCAGEPKTLVTYYSLEPDVDHHVTITFANETALFYVNCSRIYSFCIQCLVDRKLPANRWVTAGTVVSPPKSATASVSCGAVAASVLRYSSVLVPDRICGFIPIRFLPTTQVALER